MDPTTEQNYRDRSSPFASTQRNEQLCREQGIASEYLEIVRERLSHCIGIEGINSFVGCKDLREQYMRIANDRYKGMIFPKGQQPFNRRTPGLILGPDDPYAPK